MEFELKKDMRIAVLAGGSSDEREISIQSGVAATKALRGIGYSAEMVDPSEKTDLAKIVSGQFDVAFLCLHGKGGEDGTIQGFLETAGIPYTGSGLLASAIAIDKDKSKTVYRDCSLPTPQSITVTSDMKITDDLLNEVKLPCVVKPATEGSALGVFLVDSVEDLKPSILKVFKLDKEVLVETYVSGVEVTVAVLGNKEPKALPVIEIIPSHKFYDFESKYAPGGSKHICPARLSEEDTSKVKDLAERAHAALGCRGVSRTDMIIDGNGDPWILETNTIPGMTETSLLPDAARADGIEFPELCEKLLELAFE